jgi:outer membrane receptor protein involved in Fe transport
MRFTRLASSALFGTAFLGLLTARPAAAQARSATIVGRVIDAASGAGVTDAGVQIVGTTLGTQSGLDGRYTIRNVPAGTITVQARRIGFAPKTITALMAAAGETVVLDIALEAATVQLTAQVVTAAAERGTVSAALDEQRTAAGVVNAITREQIAKSPDADAAQAVQRVSGVTVQDGKFVFVRGLGERYTTASLNGSRIPSPEPERKVVPLDLFPSALLQSVTTIKTFTPDQPGDFSGAQIDIRTREFPATRVLSYSVASGFNDAATARRIPYAPGVGGESFAMANSARNLPAGLKAAGDLVNVTQRDVNAFIRSFRDVWEAPLHQAALPKSASVTVGGSDPVFGREIGYIASGTYSVSDEVRVDQVRATANPGNTPGSTTEINRFEGTTGRTSVLWGGVVNLSALLGTRTRLSLDNTYDRTADNDARVERGFLENYGIPVRMQRLQYVERSVYSSQLGGEHELWNRHRLQWAVAASGVARREPDRSDLVQQIATDSAGRGESLLWFNGEKGAVRTFATLEERSIEARTDYRWELGSGSSPHAIKVGGLVRRTHRDADNRTFSILGANIDDSVKALPPEQLFGARFTAPDASVLLLSPLGQGGSYGARDRIAAGYVMTELGLARRLRLVAGARVEHWSLQLDGSTLLGDRTYVRSTLTDALPAAALNVLVSDRQNLRLAATRTLARPEYRELTNSCSFEALGAVTVCGNPTLARTLIDNFDLRWELYPRSAEVISVGVFAKRFQDPIEQIYLANSGSENRMTFVNAHRAENVGVELELRQRLDRFGAGLAPVVAFANATLMRSTIVVGAADASYTHDRRRMVGQAPYVVNAGLTYASRSGATSATVLYNRVGPRLLAAGSRPLPDVVDRARNVLDVSLRFPVLQGLMARVDARNLLDDRYLVTQGTVTADAYRVGRTFQVGVTWQR